MKNWAAILAAIILIGAGLAAIYYILIFTLMAVIGLRVWWLLVFGVMWVVVVYVCAKVIDRVVK